MLLLFSSLLFFFTLLLFFLSFKQIIPSNFSFPSTLHSHLHSTLLRLLLLLAHLSFHINLLFCVLLTPHSPPHSHLLSKLDSFNTRRFNTPPMCRMLLYKGNQPIQLAHLLTKPAHSIINQSFDSRLRLDTRRPINGDGFGVGWYESEPDPELGAAPCIFTSVTPAWNNMNLIRLADKIKSPLVFAHVRASTAGSVSESNCHPWQYGRLMFMHNGNIADFHLIKRKVQESLTDEIFLTVNGNTDSEWAFAVFLNQLETPRQAEPFCHSVLKEAMLKAIAKLNAWGKEAGITEASMMNFAVTDGVSVVCSRYISSRTLEAASLYFSSGTRFESYKPGHYRMIKADKREDIVVIASEPLTFEKADWLTIPTNTVVVITSKLNVLMYPIVDEYHNPRPLGRAPEGTSVAVVQGEGRGDGARDQNHREVVFVEDHRAIPTVSAVNSPRPDKEQDALAVSESTARDVPAQALASTAPVMVA